MISKSLPSRFILLYHTFKKCMRMETDNKRRESTKIVMFKYFVEKPKLFCRIGQFLEVCPISKQRWFFIQLYCFRHLYL